MPRIKLTKAEVDRAKHTGAGNQTIYKDTKLEGFGLRVSSGGVKSYVVEYRKGGRKRRVTLGRHGPLTPDQARKLALRELGAVAFGEDPAERKRQEREGDTLANVAERYLDDLKNRAEAGAKHGRLSGWESAAPLPDTKAGVGLVLIADDPISAIEISGSRDTRYTLAWATAPLPTYDDWRPAGSGTLLTGITRHQVPAAEGAWLIWLTHLPEQSDGTFAAEIWSVSLIP